MKCPKCESDNTQRLEVAFNNGTQNISTSTRATGIGFGSGGSIGIGFGKAKTSGQSQTVLAQQLAPPAKESYKSAVVYALFGTIFLYFQIIIGFQSLFGLLIALILLGTSVYRFRSAFRFNSQQWPRIYQNWAESWICHKCGGVYHHA